MARSKKVTKRKTRKAPNNVNGHYRGPPESVKDKLPSSKKTPKKKIKHKGKTRYA